ncbi:beta-glucosidase BglX [Metabacillus sp. GX 13764]|uniref:beta-glucosidase BglX n=1 Tax=Metabacillus kandeliae TaxID=2900151 RepID=UPI001E520A10|nr:beta-glucosidase BglX [Metabacillus kandeliae]MCD7035151.1 beta-glucosidase BglX [Metabacillus kandeliae]
MLTAPRETLLASMTLDEKIAQLLQLAAPFFKGSEHEGQITGPLAGLGISESTAAAAGSVLGASGAKESISIQKAYLEESRHGIPLLIMADIIHGYKTIFPVPIAIGCSWDTVLAEESAAIAALEAAVSGIHVTFAPMADLVRDPRWGRVMESTGEDPYLNSVFARAFVRGFQGKNLTEDLSKIASCVKHFAAYGAAEGGRDYNTVNMSERELRELYLPAYKAALEEGAEMVMTSFNVVDGVPATGNKWLMRKLLREEWQFNGILISDWGAVKEQIPHGTAEDEKEAAKKAIEAGVDIEMMTACYPGYLKELIEEGSVNEGLVDEAVLRILDLKEKLGLFDNPYRAADEEKEQEIVFSKQHRDTARILAEKSCVLLKNEGVLPLQKEQKIAVIGPFADNGDILGPWSWHGSKEDAVTVLAGLQKKNLPEILTAQGSHIETGSEEMLKEAEKAAEQADVIVLALGEASEMSGEAGSRASIQLPPVQLQLVQRMKAMKKPIAAVLFNGRPLDLHGVIEHCDAVLEAWFPGSEGGDAITNLLLGEANPSGKLSMSFPYSAGQIPVYYNNYNTGRPKDAPDAQERYVSQYLDIPNEPLFPFGFGLSYTAFDCSHASLSSEILSPQGELTVSAQVTNTGEYAGEEVVQLYVQDLSGEVVRPLKELKAFQKIELAPGETKEVSFTLSEKDLRYYHSDLSFKSDAGKFHAFIGGSSRDLAPLSFELLHMKEEDMK